MLLLEHGRNDPAALIGVEDDIAVGDRKTISAAGRHFSRSASNLARFC